ncbi:hypothetical protein DYB37_005739 [Aphanomyces astaci]|uniref:Uncharacterized protein n=1 Tax=Aphanomyces astaci TaxID=112090 RepID=A0A397D3Y0_APHAT|nr:hypothetical protein DYB36_012903 [Aphanomyces astaci]RHY11098.1 hypothetical protein DYB25_004727 [Aphanomyces astaci]RHY38935.1 hypothetical protein DYB34_005766 [Aphanomyces astaci]RHY55678.1 hypothetical protein DYB30_006252 [Aphanomyces astaci]RHY58238.1 hypothetical protein DYB38_000647 [Aphanomyces astaci]
MALLDKRFYRPLHIFSVGLCSVLTVKLVLFTEYKSPMGLPDQEHVFTGYTQEQLDKFFKVDEVAQQRKQQAAKNDADK